MVVWRSWYRIWLSWRDMLEILEMSVLFAILVGRCVVERERPSNEDLRVVKDRFSELVSAVEGTRVRRVVW